MAYSKLITLFVCLSFVFLTRNVKAIPSISFFTAEGTVSWEGFQHSSTNAVSQTEGQFLFLYSNGVWQVQFTYRTNFYIGASSLPNVAGETIDIRRIPDGIREVVTTPTNAVLSGSNWPRTTASANATTNRFPDWGMQQLFLPWLSLCPMPELPFVKSNLMRIDFRSPENSKNTGKYKLNYIVPENQFISELIVTNNGILFLADGSTQMLPGSYKNGYPQFSYKVIETTNYNGIVFPLKTILYQFLPAAPRKSPEDIYAVVISRVQITRIDMNGQLALIPVPKSLVALDRRPAGLNDGVTVNYEVVDDNWPSLTNNWLKGIIKTITPLTSGAVEQEEKYTRNRYILYVIFFLLATAPLIILIRNACKKQTK